MRIENKNNLLKLTGPEYARALITLHHCDNATLAHVGLSRQELDELITAEKITPPAMQIVGSPAPLPRVSWSPKQFLERFTQNERIAIRTAARTSPQLEDYLDMLRTTRVVYADDSTTINGLAALMDAGLLRKSRMDEILTDESERGLMAT